MGAKVMLTVIDDIDYRNGHDPLLQVALCTLARGLYGKSIGRKTVCGYLPSTSCPSAHSHKCTRLRSCCLF